MDADEDGARLLRLIECQPSAGRDGLVGWLDGLCAVVVQEIAAMGAVITVGPPVAGSTVLAATSSRCREWSEIEFGVGEGPAQLAWTTRRPVLVPALERAPVGRWPGYTTAALAAGIGAVFAFPLQVGAGRIGVLTVVDDQPRHLTSTELSRCLRLADLATQRLIDDTTGTGGSGPRDGAAHGLDPVLADGVDHRSRIYQAQGMMAVKLGISLLDSLAKMRAHAFATGRELAAIADDVLDAGLQLSDDGDETSHDGPAENPEQG